MQIEITKQVNVDLLREELAREFPELGARGAPGPNPYQFILLQEDGRLYLIYPDDYPEDAIRAVLEAHDHNNPSEQALFHSQIAQISQSTVGKKLEDLTADEQTALIAALLYKMGGIAGDLTIKPLEEWGK